MRRYPSLSLRFDIPVVLFVEIVEPSAGLFVLEGGLEKELEVDVCEAKFGGDRERSGLVLLVGGQSGFWSGFFHFYEERNRLFSVIFII